MGERRQTRHHHRGGRRPGARSGGHDRSPMFEDMPEFDSPAMTVPERPVETPPLAVPETHTETAGEKPAETAAPRVQAPAVELAENRPKLSKEELMEVINLQYMGIMDLRELATAVGIQGVNQYKKFELVHKVIQSRSPGSGLQYSRGILDVLPDGYGFLRTQNYRPNPEDVYVSQAQIRRFGIKVGDLVAGIVRAPKEGERYYSLVRIDSVNGQDPDTLRSRPLFQNLTPLYPDSHMKLEWDKVQLTSRLIDIIAPIGKGQRGMVVSPPKAGKTTILKDIANAVHRNHPEVWIKVLLVDERPEEVTDMERSVHGEVMSSTFDEPPENHVKVAEMVLESAKRMVECGMDVLILLDSITRLARAYNLVVPPSGRTLSGGIDPSSLHKPKRFFGGARNIEGGGSLTIIATALVDTGSRMDDIIYEEFKGTGNMELHLDRNLANRRVFPAIDVVASGTRKEELLMPADRLQKIYMLRRNMEGDTATEELIKLLKNTKTNDEFFASEIFKY